MKQSVYIVTALCAGVALGVFAAELRNPVDASGDLDAEFPPEAGLGSDPGPNPGRETTASTMHTVTGSEEAGALARLREEMEHAARERQALLAGHAELQTQLERLEERLAFAVGVGEDTLRPPAIDADANGNPWNGAQATDNDRELQALLSIGLDAYEAAEIRRRTGEAEMARLYLRDRAIREGWFGNERYQEEVEALEDPQNTLRARLGEEAFDRYLYASGEDNRIRIQGVIEASPAAAAGLEPGDVIRRYADQRIFSATDLRAAIAEGIAGESVSVEISRNGSRRSFYLNRGPLGVRLGGARVEP